MAKNNPAPICPYCSHPAVLLKGSQMPFRGNAAYDDRYFWVCEPCNAWVGCHKGGNRAFGELANRHVRRLRREVHHAFDPIWEADQGRGRSRFQSREKAYRWLADKLGIDREACHIGMFDETACVVALAILRQRKAA